MNPEGGHFGEGDGAIFTLLRLETVFFLVGVAFFLATGFFVTFGVALALGFGVALAVDLTVGFGVGLVVAPSAVLVEAIIATATIIESTRPFILDSI